MYYKLVKCNRKGSDFFGKFYGRAALVGRSVNTRELASMISKSCTVTEPDILAVISALLAEIPRLVQDGRKVELDNFGSFKLGLSTSPADTADKFTVKNVKGIHVLFQPTTNVDPATKKRYNAFTHGCKVESLPDYDDPAKAAAEAKD